MAPRSLIPHKQVRRRDRPDASEHTFLDGRYFLATCPATIAVLDLVYCSGTAFGGGRLVELVDPTDFATMPVIGIVREKPTATSCLVVVSGEVPAPGVVANRPYFAGHDGRLKFPRPSPLLGVPVFVQQVGSGIADDVLLVVPGLHASMTLVRTP